MMRQTSRDTASSGLATPGPSSRPDRGCRRPPGSGLLLAALCLVGAGPAVGPLRAAPCLPAARPLPAPSRPDGEEAGRLAEQFGLEPHPAVRLDTRSGAEIPITAYRSPRDQAEMVFIPGGPFLMGSTYDEVFDDSLVGQSARTGKAAENIIPAEMPQHEVELSPYFIDRYEVSNAQFARFLHWWEESGHSREFSHPDEPLDFDHTPYQWKKSSFSDDDRPVAGISWLSAYAYARWAGKRLPTEAEWEKAAKGPQGWRFPWGNDFDPRVCNISLSWNYRSLPVTSLPGGQSPYGCFNMCGNVNEYVLDWSNKKFYETSPRKDPLNAPTDLNALTVNKVVRGGAWNKYIQLFACRTTSRGSTRVWPTFSAHYTVDPRDFFITGFRCVVGPVDQVPPPQDPESWKRVFFNHPGARHPDGKTVVPPRPGTPLEPPGPVRDPDGDGDR